MQAFAAVAKLKASLDGVVKVTAYEDLQRQTLQEAGSDVADLKLFPAGELICDETCPGRNQRLKGGLYRGQNLTSTNQEPPACLAPNSIWQVRAGSQS